MQRWYSPFSTVRRACCAPEKGTKDVNVERTEQALETQPEIIAAGCPFCNTMMTDGIKNRNEEVKMDVLDIAEIVAQAIK